MELTYIRKDLVSNVKKKFIIFQEILIREIIQMLKISSL